MGRRSPPPRRDEGGLEASYAQVEGRCAEIGPRPLADASHVGVEEDCQPETDILLFDEGRTAHDLGRDVPPRSAQLSLVHAHPPILPDPNGSDQRLTCRAPGAVR